MKAAGPRIDDELLAVFREQRASLAAFLLRSCGDRSCAEDLLQETFLHVWNHRDSLARDGADRDAMGRYLWRAARNRMIDEIRMRQRRRGHEGPEPAGEPAATDAGPHERLEWEDCRRVVRETVERLTNHDARNCLERWLAGLGVEAIAEQLGMAPGRVRGLLQRGRAEVIQRATDRLRVNARDSA